MTTIPRPTKTAPMSADAYAGFLKLWLTPAGQLPERTPAVEAYLRHANARDPLPEAARRTISLPTHHAA